MPANMGLLLTFDCFRCRPAHQSVNTSVMSDDAPTTETVSVTVENVQNVAAGWTFDCIVAIHEIEFFVFGMRFEFGPKGAKLRPPQARRPDLSWTNAISFPPEVLHAISDAFAATIQLPGLEGGGKIRTT